LTDESVASGAEVKFDGALYARVLFPRTTTDETQYFKPGGSYYGCATALNVILI